ncbi:MAG: C10 family peptidase [Flavobacteriaceae bacterium]
MKTKLFLFLLFITLFSIETTFSQFNKNELIEYSNSFIAQQQLRKVVPESLESLINDNGEVYAHVVNLEPKGFIVFSSSKKFAPVISFSTESDFDFSNTKENILLNMIKSDTQNELQLIKNSLNLDDQKVVDRNINAWNQLRNNSNRNASSRVVALTQYGTHLTSVWGGVNCYDDLGAGINVGNYYTPNNYSPGCVATTLSMILHYYRWPETGVGSHTNYDTYGNSQTSWSANFGTATYDWDNMLDEYQGKPSTLAQQKAMGYISFHTATALDMDYESTGSTSNINRIPSVGSSYFRFSGHHQYTSWSSFWSRMQENIQNGHPVPIAIDATNGSGHAPAVDGYRFNDGDAQSEYYYHLNMGWYGTSNAWYRIRGSFSAGGYTSVSAGVFDLLPEPIMTTGSFTATSKTFNLNWRTSSTINWDAFELQESTDGGSNYTTISNAIIDTTFTRTVATGGSYRYRVRSKVDGAFYSNSYSQSIGVTVPYDYTYLDFDGNDSFFVYENSSNDFDVSSSYTIESWVKIDSRSSGTYPVILDRKTVFSMYLISDSNADYAVKFVARNNSGSVIASVQSDSSTENLSYGNWVHVAVSRSGTSTKLFINGTQASSSSDSDFSLSASSNALNIGARYWSGYGRYLNGKIDKIRITDNAVYTSNFTPDRKEIYITNTNTKMLLALDEGTGAILNDDASNFLSVQLRNSPNQPNWMFDDETQSARSAAAPVKELEAVKEAITNLYPNPAKDRITSSIKVSEDTAGEILVYDSFGKLQLSQNIKLNKGNNSIELNISKLRIGIYYIKIETKTEIFYSNFLKQ